jgi:hypothetical protein
LDVLAKIIHSLLDDTVAELDGITQPLVLTEILRTCFTLTIKTSTNPMGGFLGMKNTADTAVKDESADESSILKYGRFINHFTLVYYLLLSDVL